MHFYRNISLSARTDRSILGNSDLAMVIRADTSSSAIICNHHVTRGCGLLRVITWYTGNKANTFCFRSFEIFTVSSISSKQQKNPYASMEQSLNNTCQAKLWLQCCFKINNITVNKTTVTCEITMVITSEKAYVNSLMLLTFQPMYVFCVVFCVFIR